MLHGIGAVLIIISCGAVGFSMAAAHRREETLLRDLIQALEELYSDLQYRLTPLPELCSAAGKRQKNPIGQVFIRLARELNNQICPDVSSCLFAALAGGRELPESVQSAFRLLGNTLGQFDMEGQLRGIESVREHCEMQLKRLGVNREERLRSYQTLGLCAGAALAILFV